MFKILIILDCIKILCEKYANCPIEYPLISYTYVKGLWNGGQRISTLAYCLSHDIH